MRCLAGGRYWRPSCELARSGARSRRSAPLAAVRRAFRANGPYDVVDVATAEGLWIAAARHLGAFRRTAVDRAIEWPRTSRLSAHARRSRPRAVEQAMVPATALSRGAVVPGRRSRTRRRPPAALQRNRSRVRARARAGSRAIGSTSCPTAFRRRFSRPHRRAMRRAAAGSCSAEAGRR